MKIKKLLLLSILSLSLVSCTNTNDVKVSNTNQTDFSNVVVSPSEENFIADEYDPWEPFNKRPFYYHVLLKMNFPQNQVYFHKKLNIP